MSANIERDIPQEIEQECVAPMVCRYCKAPDVDIKAVYEFVSEKVYRLLRVEKI